MLERGLLVWLSLLSLVAFYWPYSETFDPFVASRPYLNYLIAVTMFAIGWMLPREEVREVATRWPSVAYGTLLQYTSMPLLAFGLGKLFQLDEPLMVGLLVAGCVPGAMASNVLTLIARGNVSYSVSLTTLATLLSPVFVPLSLSLLLGAKIDFLPWNASLLLALTVVIPVVLGYLIGGWLKTWQSAARRVGSTIANLTILWIIAAVVGINRDRLAEISGVVLLAVLSLNVLGYLAGNAGGRILKLPGAMQRALTLEIGTQNAGLGTVLVLQLFPSLPTAAIPTAMYTFACMFTGTMLARYWSRGVDVEPADVEVSSLAQP